MPSAADRLEFAPHPDPGALRAFSLAVVVHLLLLAALTWGVNWKHSNPDISFDAELWSSVPQEAAPKAVEAPSPPPPPPPPAPEPQVKAPPPAPTPDVDIALEREKKRKLELKKREAELAKARAEQEKLKELQAKKEKEKEKEKELKAKEDLAKRKAEETKKLEAKKTDVDKQEAQKLADQRKKNLERMLGQAGATGAADSKGSAPKSSGPSASYGGKVRAKVKPNIVFTDDVAGNPTAEVEVRTALDGTIISQRLIKSSGNKAWDDAVIKAIIRTETMPRDVDGRVPTPMILEFKRND